MKHMKRMKEGQVLFMIFMPFMVISHVAVSTLLEWLTLSSSVGTATNT